MAVRIQWDETAVRLLPDTPAVAAAVDRVAAALTGEIKRRAPVSPVTSGHSGRLRSSVRAFREPDGSVIIGPAADYAGYVVHGTPPHLIRSHGPWSLHSQVTGAYFGPLVHHPGTRPNPFVGEAVQEIAARHIREEAR
jgi:hypothetical protein